MNCEICDQISKWVQYLKGKDLISRKNELLTLYPPGAYIADLDSLRLSIKYDPMSFYVTMDESTHIFNAGLAKLGGVTVYPPLEPKNWPLPPP